MGGGTLYVLAIREQTANGGGIESWRLRDAGCLCLWNPSEQMPVVLPNATQCKLMRTAKKATTKYNDIITSAAVWIRLQASCSDARESPWEFPYPHSHCGYRGKTCGNPHGITTPSVLTAEHQIGTGFQAAWPCSRKSPWEFPYHRGNPVGIPHKCFTHRTPKSACHTYTPHIPRDFSSDAHFVLFWG